MKRMGLYLFAITVAGVVGALAGILVATILAVLWTLITGQLIEFPAYTAGFIAATITWPLDDWLEARFGLTA